MLSRLWHHPFIGGDSQQCQINASDAGQHVLDEVPMAGNIHNSYFFAIEGQPGEPQVNGHFSGLFFGQPVGINAG